jgi:hypothetical protein
LCKVDREKEPTELTIEDVDEIVNSYAEIIKAFPELAMYDYRVEKKF